MLFYANRISDNIRIREPEGFLFCVNVPIARTGTQQYMKDEIGQEGDDLVTVYRPEEEVFSQATMASFEGMPVTNDHPNDPCGVTSENAEYLTVGHCQNVRRGTGAEKDLLIADLVLFNQKAIEDVQNGKREISCGYNYELAEENGKYIQRQIRGNHVAIVDKGRAGKRVCIKDSAPNNERRKPSMGKHTSILSKMLARFARDNDTTEEEIAEAVDAIDEITAGAEEIQETPAAVEAPKTEDEAPDKLDLIIDLLQKVLAQKGTDEEPEEKPAEEEDPLKKLEDDLAELEKGAGEAAEEEEETYSPDEDPDEQENHFVDPEEINEQDEDPEEEEEEEAPVADKKACDAMRKAIKAIKPVIAALPASERKKASDAAVSQLRKAYGMDEKPAKNGYIALKSRKKVSDSKANVEDIGRKIMASRNANYNK